MIPIGYATGPCPFSINVGMARQWSVSSQITGRGLLAGSWPLWPGCRCAASEFNGTVKLQIHNKEWQTLLAVVRLVRLTLGWDFPLVVFPFLLCVKKIKLFSLKVMNKKTPKNQKLLCDLPFAFLSPLCVWTLGAGGIQCFYLKDRLCALWFHLEGYNFTADQNKTLKTLSSTANSPSCYF